MPKTKLNLVLGEGGMTGAFVAPDTGLGTHKKPSWLRAGEMSRRNRADGTGMDQLTIQNTTSARWGTRRSPDKHGSLTTVRHLEQLQGLCSTMRKPSAAEKPTVDRHTDSVRSISPAPPWAGTAQRREAPPGHNVPSPA